jgi:hypothetical protein
MNRNDIAQNWLEVLQENLANGLVIKELTPIA